MHNDRLQGILFTKSDMLDLVHRTRQERFIKKVAVIKHNVRSWNTRPDRQKLSSQLSDNYLIPKNLTGDRRIAEIDDLSKRLKTPVEY